MTSYQNSRKNNERFRRLYKKSGLTRQGVADLIGATLSSVIAWLKPETTKSSVACPNWAVERFREKLKTRK